MDHRTGRWTPGRAGGDGALSCQQLEFLQSRHFSSIGAFTVFLLVLAATSAAEAQENSTWQIQVDSFLTPGTNESAWLSPSGIFAFGFYNTSNGYAVCIYMAGIKEKTVVWTANNFNPILPNNVDYLRLQSDGVVLWQNRDDFEFLYAQISGPDDSVDGASMLDNGNFVVYNSDGRVVWQSFDYPTEALLPGQRLPVGRELVSRASETDLSRGLFRIKMQSDSNLVQYPVRTPDTSEHAYYSSETWKTLGTNASLNLEKDGRLYLFSESSESYNLTSGGNSVEGTIYLARVDPDGIFRLYNRSLDSDGNWTAVWWSTKDKCRPKGICGVNSFCSHDGGQIVTCTCLPGFKDSGGGCKEVFVAKDCKDKNPAVKYEMESIPDVIWEDNYYVSSHATNEEDCRGSCLNDCDCAAALFKMASAGNRGYLSYMGKGLLVVKMMIQTRQSYFIRPAFSWRRSGWFRFRIWKRASREEGIKSE